MLLKNKIVDGTSIKRYGHSSKLVANFLISAGIGFVLDYQIKFSIYKQCEYHQNDIKDHQRLSIIFGFQTRWKKDAVVEMLCPSLDRPKLKYLVFIGDSDTNLFAEVKEK